MIEQDRVTTATATQRGRGRSRRPCGRGARRLRRPGRGQAADEDLHRGRAPARRGARPRADLRAARARQDDARAHRRRTRWASSLRQTSGPVLERPGDLAAILTNLQPRDVLFVDEIHRLSPVVEEILYPAMEDCQLDIMIGEGPAARSIKLDLPPFTLVGATTRAGLLTSPLRDRFGIVQRLEYYSEEEICQRSSCARPASSSADIDAAGATAHRRSARAARRASPTACCGACGTTRRCVRRVASTRRSRRARSTCSKSTSRASTCWTAGCC